MRPAKRQRRDEGATGLSLPVLVADYLTAAILDKHLALPSSAPSRRFTPDSAPSLLSLPAADQAIINAAVKQTRTGNLDARHIEAILNLPSLLAFLSSSSALFSSSGLTEPEKKDCRAIVRAYLRTIDPFATASIACTPIYAQRRSHLASLSSLNSTPSTTTTHTELGLISNRLILPNERLKDVTTQILPLSEEFEDELVDRACSYSILSKDLGAAFGIGTGCLLFGSARWLNVRAPCMGVGSEADARPAGVRAWVEFMLERQL